MNAWGQPSLGQTAASLDTDAQSSSVAAVTQSISSAISMGMLSVGERLPPEIDLAHQFGIAVATLRKALAQLREQGVVETRRGRSGGTFIVQTPFPKPEELCASLERTSVIALRDFFDEHAAISGMAARLAAERTQLGQRTRLAEFAFQARDARTMRDRAMADSRFHFEIAVLSQSARLLAAEQRLQSELSPFLWCDEVCSASTHLAFTEHLAMVMAIEQQDAETAERLAVEHVHGNMHLIITGKLALNRKQLDGSDAARQATGAVRSGTKGKQ
ncbi:FadR family transcriptional regulator [Leucobacter sp. cx-42]|uniref:FadR/GntR family transcriptional regulator n=1 Tax=unclassified Leucobacter TaxID=2621730 RepID=UPI00165D8F4D|nr:FadR family transcriptional regulator [Leucobacter sp. cx-42]